MTTSLARSMEKALEAAASLLDPTTTTPESVAAVELTIRVPSVLYLWLHLDNESLPLQIIQLYQRHARATRSAPEMMAPVLQLLSAEMDNVDFSIHQEAPQPPQPSSVTRAFSVKICYKSAAQLENEDRHEQQGQTRLPNVRNKPASARGTTIYTPKNGPLRKEGRGGLTASPDQFGHLQQELGEAVGTSTGVLDGGHSHDDNSVGPAQSRRGRKRTRSDYAPQHPRPGHISHPSHPPSSQHHDSEVPSSREREGEEEEEEQEQEEHRTETQKRIHEPCSPLSVRENSRSRGDSQSGTTPLQRIQRQLDQSIAALSSEKSKNASLLARRCELETEVHMLQTRLGHSEACARKRAAERDGRIREMEAQYQSCNSELTRSASAEKTLRSRLDILAAKRREQDDVVRGLEAELGQAHQETTEASHEVRALRAKLQETQTENLRLRLWELTVPQLQELCEQARLELGGKLVKKDLVGALMTQGGEDLEALAQALDTPDRRMG